MLNEYYGDKGLKFELKTIITPYNGKGNKLTMVLELKCSINVKKFMEEFYSIPTDGFNRCVEFSVARVQKKINLQNLIPLERKDISKVHTEQHSDLIPPSFRETHYNTL